MRKAFLRLLCSIGIHDLKKHLYICERCGARFRKSMVMDPDAPRYDPPKR